MRILLAEDDIDLQEILVDLLKMNNFSVDAVANGQDALDFLETQNYDGAILDIMMPIMDGLTVLKLIREKGIQTPVIMLTAKGEVDDRVLGLDCGANDYLPKPFVSKELLARVRAMTRLQNEISDSNIQFGNITLNRQTFELSSQFGSYRLTNKEFQLLEMLIDNHNSYLTTEQMMDRIWGYDCDSEINVVWAHISYLRKKLEALNASFKIKAVRNSGYILELKHD